MFCCPCLKGTCVCVCIPLIIMRSRNKTMNSFRQGEVPPLQVYCHWRHLQSVVLPGLISLAYLHLASWTVELLWISGGFRFTRPEWKVSLMHNHCQDFGLGNLKEGEDKLIILTLQLLYLIRSVCVCVCVSLSLSCLVRCKDRWLAMLMFCFAYHFRRLLCLVLPLSGYMASIFFFAFLTSTFLVYACIFCIFDLHCFTLCFCTFLHCLFVFFAMCFCPCIFFACLICLFLHCVFALAFFLHFSCAFSLHCVFALACFLHFSFAFFFALQVAFFKIAVF